ncbi:MAG: alpha/beta fold hydrolase [Elainellaceae cyanobacterium]
MPYIDIRGVNHYYEWISDAKSTDLSQPKTEKPVMVFLHGWAGSTRYWESTARTLAPYFDCLLYDLRGFGRSLLPRPIQVEVDALGYELESYADDLAILLDQFGIDSIYLNAHSTGASIATLFLNRYSTRVKRAILTCSGIFEYNERAFGAFHTFGGYVVRFRPNWFLSIPFLERMFMARFLHRQIPGADQRAFLEDFLKADYEAALGTIYTAVSKYAADTMPKEFARLSVPTLLISGQYDKIIPAEMGRQAAALSDAVTQVVIPKTSHFPMLEDPPTYLQHVQEFLQAEVASMTH